MKHALFHIAVIGMVLLAAGAQAADFLISLGAIQRPESVIPSVLARDLASASKARCFANTLSMTTDATPTLETRPGLFFMFQQAAARLDKLKFKGAEVFSLKLKDDGLKVVDDKETELARIRVEGGEKIKIRDGQDITLGYVVGTDPQWNLKDAKQEKTLFRLSREANGDLKLEDGAGTLVCNIRKAPARAEVVDGEGKGLFRVQTVGGKTSIRDNADKVVLTTEAVIEPQVAALFVLKELKLPQRAAFWLAMEQSQKLEK